MVQQAISGSERFSYIPSTADKIRESVSGHVGLHDITDAEYEALDVLSYEIIRHRLVAVTTEMGDVLKRMSGSLIVAEVNDFNTGIMDEVGDVVSVGLYNTQLTAAMDLVVKWTLEHRAANPGIEAGDIFLGNDPWIGGGVHQSDVSIFAPIFVEGDIFAWTCTSAHQVDVGGLSPGSFSVHSKNVFSESTPIPPVKLVSRGKLLSDIEDMYVRRSRVPNVLGLDLRAMIGTIKVAQDRIHSLTRKYGAAVVKATMRRMMLDSERLLKKRLMSLPDCTKRSVAYIESATAGDRGLYKIELKASKMGETLRLDFTGTSPQVDGFINSTYAGLRGGVFTALLPLLCGDIPWAIGGLMRCVEILSEEATLNNCRFPAGISKASVGAAWATQNAVHEAVASVMDLSAETRTRVAALPMAPCGVILSGLDQRGEGFVGHLADSMAGGYGALSHRDGVDTGGCFCMPMGLVADVEMNEFTMPVLYLWRRERIDSGGAGRYRGGVGGSIAVIPHGAPGGGLQVLTTGMGKAIATGVGLSGGLPGAAQEDIIMRDTPFSECARKSLLPVSMSECGNAFDVIAVHSEGEMGANDIIISSWHGGGGYGDPLHRDLEAVRHDIAEGKVSIEAASSIYGVILNSEGDEIDSAASMARRSAIRSERAGLRESV